MNIYIINTVGSGLDTINIIADRIELKGIIGLSERQPGDKISDFIFQEEFCRKKSIDFFEVDSYSLKNLQDREKLEKLDIDVLIVTGWQRLLPNWLINSCKICVIGAHGSPFSITGGRGRSPQNWALLLGLKEFYISIFSVDSGIDSGKIIDTKKFVYNEFDDISTSYHKISILVANMIIDRINDGTIAAQNFKEQDDDEAFYFPQRKPEDGYIDWSRSAIAIYNFIRALTKPYPGAKTKSGDSDIIIYRGIPFEIDIDGSFEPGVIVSKFHNGDVLVATKEGYILITDYIGDFSFTKVGEKLYSESTNYQTERIVKRHYAKYPENRISKAILKLIKR